MKREDAPQRDYPSRELFDALRYLAQSGCGWRFLPHDFPPWTPVHQQAWRWMAAKVFEAAVHDLRILRLVAESAAAAPLGGRTDLRLARPLPRAFNSA